MAEANATHYLAGPLEGYKIERFENVIRVTRPDGVICREDTLATVTAACVSLWLIRNQMYRAADK